MKAIDLNKRQKSILELFGLQIVKINKKEYAFIGFLVLIVFAGFYAIYKQVAEGHGVTGMRDNVVWGYYISNFIYFIGVSYGGALLAAVLYYFKIPWGKPIIRIATIMAFISGIIGPFFILLCIGRLERLHYLVIYARVQSPITWDVMVISTYLVGISIFLYLLLIKDFAILRDTKMFKSPAWKLKLYRFLALGYDGSEKQENIIDKSTRSVAFILVPKVILAFSVLSWIFGMTLRPGWHSTIFGPTFVISSIATGMALVILLMWLYRKLYKLEDYLTNNQFKYMGNILLGLTCIYAYFTFSEYITVWYSSGGWETEVMNKLFNLNEFGWPFHLSNFFAIILPIIVLSWRRLRTPDIIASMSLTLVVAMWVKRYLTVVPTLETTLIPIQDIRPEYVSYSATWVEWILVFSGAATFIIFCYVLPKVVNIIPIADCEPNKP
jgi:molybdopterin-containing oxidoreductase family membrane subunit